MTSPATTQIPARLLREVGRVLFGERWQVPLAKLLKEPSPRRMQRWAAAAKDDRPYTVSEDALKQLLGAMDRRVFDVQTTYDTLKGFYDGV